MGNPSLTINHFVHIVAKNVPGPTTDPQQIIRHCEYHDSQGNTAPCDATGSKTLDTVVAPGDSITFFFSPNITNSGLQPNTGHITETHRKDGLPSYQKQPPVDSDGVGSITVVVPSDAPNVDIPYGLMVDYQNGNGQTIKDIPFDPVITVRSAGSGQ